MSRLSFAALFACAALSLVCATEARAQNQGTIIGDVIDGESGEPVPGVNVTATSPALQGSQSAVSDDQGRFRIDALPIGSYALSFQKEGVSAEPITDIQLRAGATLRYDAVVYREGSPLYGVGGASTGVVRVTAPVVDVGSTQSGGTINSDITRRVPLVAPGAKGGANRSFEAAAQAMPQVQNDNFGASVNGATSVENQYVIDGISVNNMAYGYLGSPLSLEFIEEVSVVTGGYMPEYGRSMGGLLNVVTKSGSNELKGSIFTNISPGFLEGDRAVIGNEGSAVRISPELNYVGDVGFELGGPIIKDELWFYVGADLARQSFKIGRELFRSNGTAIEGSRQDFFAESTSMQAIAKLTWAANADNRLSFTVLATPSVSGGDGKLGIDQRTGKPEVFSSFEGSYNALAHIYQAGGIDGQVRWQLALLERKLRLDTSLAYHHEVSSLGGQPSDGSTIGSGQGLSAVPRVFFRRSIPGPHSIADFEQLPKDANCDPAGTDAATECPVTTYQFGGPDFIDEQVGGSLQLRHVTSYVMEAFGLHVLKAGAELGYGSFNNHRAYSGGRRYRDNASGTLFTDNRQFGFMTAPDEAVVMESLQWETHNIVAAAFLQDSWTLADIVTLNLGLRYDGEWMFAGDGSSSLALPLQVSPRAGVIVDPFKSGRVKLYGAFARYYETVPLDIADRAGSSEPQITSGRPAAVCDPRDPAQNSSDACLNDDNLIALNEVNAPNQKWVVVGAGRTAIDPDIQPPSSDEITLGAEAEIFRDARVAISYTKRWIGCPWTGAEDIGDGMVCTRAIEDMSRDEANTYFIGNPGFGIAEDFPIAQRDYDALTLLFHKQWSDGWLAQGSYTLASLRGNYAGLFRPETEQLDPNINSDFDLVSLTQNRQGPLPFDKNHQLKAYAAKEFEAAYGSHFTLGAAAQANSGTPSNLLGGHPIYGGGEVFVLPRGSGERLPWVVSGDVHAGFTFVRFGEGQSIEITVDVFNVFNFQAATLFDEIYTDADVNPIQNCKEGVADSCTQEDLGKLQNTDTSAFDPLAKNPNFGQPLEYQAPRTVRLGVRWSF
jgi:hypothetical protein